MPNPVNNNSFLIKIEKYIGFNWFRNYQGNLLNGHSQDLEENMKNKARWRKRHRCCDFHYTVDNVPDDSLMEKIENN